MKQQDDRLSLEVWVPATGAYQHVEIFPRDEPKEIKVLGKILGIFPRTGDEVVSWLLEREDNELRAYRLNEGGNSGKWRSRLQNATASLYGCGCGVLSCHPPKAVLACLNCRSRDILLDHRCKGIPRAARLASSFEVCPLCNAQVVPESKNDDQADEARGTQQQSRITISSTPRTHSALRSNAKPSQSRRFWISLAPIALLVVIGGGGIYLGTGGPEEDWTELEREIEMASAEQRILVPAINSLVHHCGKLASIDSAQEHRKKLSYRCTSEIRGKAEATLISIYSGRGAEAVEWETLESAFGVLVLLACSEEPEANSSCKRFKAGQMLVQGELVLRQRSLPQPRRLEAALRRFDLAKVADPTWSLPMFKIGETHARLAVVSSHRRQQDLATAEDYFLGAVDLRPPLGAAHERLAEISIQKGHIADAIRHLDNAVAVDPSDVSLQRKRVRFLAKYGGCERVGQVLGRTQRRPIKLYAEEMFERWCE